MRSLRALRFLAPVVLTPGIVALSGACATELVSPSPQVGAVAPNLICATQGDVVLPSVSLLRTADVAGGPSGATSGVDPIVVSGDPKIAGSERLSWVSAEELAVAFDPTSAPPPGVYDITVTNPDGARRASIAGGLAAIAAPKITSIDPTALCTDQSDQTFVLRGENFLKVGDDVVTVRVGEATFTPKATDCTALPGERLGGAAALCKTLTIVVPKGALAPGKYPVSVEDPSGVACRSTESITLEVKAPPTVTALGKPTVCEGGSAISVRGTGFEKGAEVLVRCGAAETKVSATNVAADGTSLDAKVGAIGKAGDVCEVVVRNPSGCEDRPLPHKTVTVTEGPFLYLVDPEVTYSGVDTGVQLFMTKVVARRRSPSPRGRGEGARANGGPQPSESTCHCRPEGARRRRLGRDRRRRERVRRHAPEGACCGDDADVDARPPRPAVWEHP
ncbi:hypothetical protein OUZ56_032389 [Daphnia magna]|uniref:IPT/TIG domain-containing protein n=1 Tax=Daphnia magna TaxID=35525 RepID=A0ABR0B8S3_9CRUS|nr:hypothetical protein OUZ56_032389 [Daphnia magna]